MIKIYCTICKKSFYSEFDDGDCPNCEKIFACQECGQVYYDSHPTQCMRYNITSGECASTDFIIIDKKDIMMKKDIPKYLFNLFIKKLF